MEPLSNFLRQAKKAGMPRDQVTRFLRSGYIPTPRQMMLHAAARRADEPRGPDEIGFGGARGPGKSHGTLAQIGLDDCQRWPGCKALYLRKVGRQAREQFDDLCRRVFRHMRYNYNKSSSVLSFPNGSRIYVGGFAHESDVDKFLGLEYDVIDIEETTSLSRSKYQALRDSNRSSNPAIRPRIYNTTNPGGIGHRWYKERFVDPERDGTAEYSCFISATIDDNPHIDDGYRRKLEENTGWRNRAYRYGDWEIAIGMFFDSWRRDVHVIPPFEIPHDWPIWASMDYGLGHVNVILLFAQDGDGNRYIIGEYGARGQLPTHHAEQYRSMLIQMGIDEERVFPFVAGSDVFARRVTEKRVLSVADQYSELGIELKPANMDRVNGAAEILRRLGNVDDDSSSTLFVFDRCVNTAKQIPDMVHNPKNPEDVLKVDVDEDGQGGDDYYDCARYGLMVPPHVVGASTGGFVIESQDPISDYDKGGF